MKKYNFLIDIFNNNLLKFTNIFTTIEYCNPNENYDKFCENNIKNSNRKSLCLFYINLMKEDIVDKQTIINIITKLQLYFVEQISHEGNKEIVDEV
jgi:hypothetical protein